MRAEESIMTLFADPNTMQSLSFGDKMTASFITMCMGMGITFAILILIWVFITIMGKCLSVGDKKKAEPVAASPSAAPAVKEEAVASASDDSLVAVIAAAIAAYQGGNANNLVVKKITRLSGDNTPWGVSSLEERLQTRRF